MESERRKEKKKSFKRDNNPGTNDIVLSRGKSVNTDVYSTFDYRYFTVHHASRVFKSEVLDEKRAAKQPVKMDANIAALYPSLATLARYSTTLPIF